MATQQSRLGDSTVGIASSVIGTAVLLLVVFGADSGNGITNGTAVILGILGLLFGLLFSAYVARTINSFTSKAIWMSQRSTLLQRGLAPFFRRSALATTTSSLGLFYGLIVGIIVHIVLLPVWLGLGNGTTTAVEGLAAVGTIGILGWLLYGIATGTSYGLLLERR